MIIERGEGGGVDFKYVRCMVTMLADLYMCKYIHIIIIYVYTVLVWLQHTVQPIRLLLCNYPTTLESTAT